VGFLFSQLWKTLKFYVKIIYELSTKRNRL
jgi:hypothetical protein